MKKLIITLIFVAFSPALYARGNDTYIKPEIVPYGDVDPAYMKKHDTLVKYQMAFVARSIHSWRIDRQNPTVYDWRWEWNVRKGKVQDGDIMSERMGKRLKKFYDLSLGMSISTIYPFYPLYGMNYRTAGHKDDPIGFERVGIYKRIVGYTNDRRAFCDWSGVTWLPGMMWFDAGYLGNARSKVATDGQWWINADFSIAYPQVLPPQYRVWNGGKTVDHINYLPSTWDEATYFNPEGIFIYVYDADELREASEDWVLHDRLAYGIEDDWEEDLNSPWEKHREQGNNKKNPARLTYPRIIEDINDEYLCFLRAHIYARTELAKRDLVSRLHPAPQWSAQTDYEYDGNRYCTDEKVIFCGHERFGISERWPVRDDAKALDAYADEVRKMNIYRYWEGIYKSYDKAYYYAGKYTEAMEANNIPEAQKWARLCRLIDRFRDLYIEMSTARAKDCGDTYKEDFVRYYHPDRLSVAVWSGSSGSGKLRHYSMSGLKTLFPYFEGKDIPGKMGIRWGTRVEKEIHAWGAGGMRKWLVEHGCTDKEILDDPATLWLIMDKYFNIAGNAGKWFQNVDMRGFDRYIYQSSDKRGVVEKTVNDAHTMNTGGLIYAGYIDRPFDDPAIRKHYRTMKNLWEQALKGPYVVMSSQTYWKYGHQYFEKRAGRKLIKADATGAIIEASARLQADTKPERGRTLAREPYFMMTREETNPRRPELVLDDHLSRKDASDERKFREQESRKSKRFARVRGMLRDALKKDDRENPGLRAIGLDDYLVRPYDRGARIVQFMIVKDCGKTEKGHDIIPGHLILTEECLKNPEKLKAFIAKYYPSFLGNPNLFTAYYRVYQDINLESAAYKEGGIEYEGVHFSPKNFAYNWAAPNSSFRPVIGNTFENYRRIQPETVLSRYVESREPGTALDLYLKSRANETESTGHRSGIVELARHGKLRKTLYTPADDFPFYSRQVSPHHTGNTVRLSHDPASYLMSYEKVDTDLWYPGDMLDMNKVTDDQAFWSKELFPDMVKTPDVTALWRTITYYSKYYFKKRRFDQYNRYYQPVYVNYEPLYLSGMYLRMLKNGTTDSKAKTEKHTKKYQSIKEWQDDWWERGYESNEMSGPIRYPGLPGIDLDPRTLGIPLAPPKN